ncbi:hypothetical protein [Gimesia fumaroli]|uniref:Uncharacterized protein n=1 Tax=Gimesia fumaroli TaxID=2527976 RepID=A0A518IB32_9PLAN|nr:hypothetical protein [Gimesia fumaroli]QDV50305.1 hypothetical protein Enr17x_23430 [Gimesia fumaroli]
MLTDIGEFIVGAYLQLIVKCDFIDYNVRTPGGGQKGLNELDVIGFNFDTETAYLCEVTTHIGGLLYVNNQETISRIKKKHQHQKAYAKQHLTKFAHHEFMFWSPVVPVGYLTNHLEKMKTLDVIINGEYKKRVEELKTLAKNTTYDARNPFFRMLQIMEHMRD